jgi:hypothetical protein
VRLKAVVDPLRELDREGAGVHRGEDTR